jgi:hypothetical protein
MPFTLAHPLAVFPFRKTRLDMTSLVIGSMAPDFDYIIHTQTGTMLSHSLSGIIYYCLPITMGIAFLWHFIIKISLASALPKPLVRKYSDWLSNSWECTSFIHFLVILVSAVIGIITHLAWDSFTHISGYFVQNIPFLTKTTIIYNLPVYKILQYGCGIVGGILVLFVVVVHSSHKPDFIVHRHPRIFWLTMFFIFVVFCIGRSFALPDVTFAKLLRYAVVNFLSGLFISVTLASIVVRIYNRFHQSYIRA